MYYRYYIIYLCDGKSALMLLKAKGQVMRLVLCSWVMLVSP